MRPNRPRLAASTRGRGSAPGGDRQPRQGDPSRTAVAGCPPAGIRSAGCAEVDDQPDHRERLERNPPDAEPAHLEQAGELLRPAAPAAGRARLDMERGRRRPAARTATSRPAASSSAAPAATCRCPTAPRISTALAPTSTAVAWMVGERRHIAGRRTMKRAPSTRGSSPSPPAAVRFSTQMRPPCASTICLEIDRPSPEFWPKPCSGRSV